MILQAAGVARGLAKSGLIPVHPENQIRA